MPAPTGRPARTHRTQEERTAATRRALLDATVDCLVEYGYHGTTTTRVVERAGVSRGAQVHHFPTKNDLVIGAVRHLAAKRTEQLRERRGAGRLPGGDDWAGELLDVLWEAHQGALFEASMELWNAARTDPDLREHVSALERMVLDSVAELGGMLGRDAADPGFRGDLYLVLDAIRGLRMLDFVNPGPPERAAARWAHAKERLRLITDRWAGDAGHPEPPSP
ncbi:MULTISPECIES: TetR/AcrR family transcriptional regulator [unclassified Actinomadura]|uniref:TetR/AcrR family transcriptional regulator n=1 Tax=unclassified Actinomadura TaxID=2626254 RepID=UPI0011EDB4DD|nr:TetR/AcrR family transcriptional regulator [Actinomadura sp. K4S16]